MVDTIEGMEKRILTENNIIRRSYSEDEKNRAVLLLPILEKRLEELKENVRLLELKEKSESEMV